MKKILFSFLPSGLFAVAAPVIFYIVNRDNRILNGWTEISGSILITLTSGIIFYTLVYLLTRKAYPAGAITAILILGTFYLWQIALLLALVVLICLGALRLLRQEISFFKLNLLFCALSLALVGLYGGQLGIFLARQPSISPTNLVEPIIASQFSLDKNIQKPDIYYIILDGYGRADMLQSVYGYDNSDFIRALQGLGFIIADQSRANYPQTVLSLGSSLNMQYLDRLAAQMDSSNAWWLSKDALYHSQVRQFLEAQDYRTVFIASGFDYTDIRDGDEFIKPFPLMLNNFDAGFLRFTNLGALGSMGGLIPYPSYSTLRLIIQADFEALPKAASEAGPKFVFAHITAPHPPFVFDENGQPVNPDTPFTMVDKMRDIMDEPTYMASYIAELEYINSRTIEVLRTILAEASTPPIILLQGDHGPGLYLKGTPEDSCLYERYSILNAYYLPGRPASAISETITPVNSFRLIFNEYFSTHIPLLPDQAYFANYQHFYDFIDVSDQVEPGCKSKAVH